ncbi:DUF1552 domain-containing protein [Thalassoroseus pseudoceratinae]|uniref:DUF1552 domain-containing protein n=1 Tax=Thalassoroseus pseudoceratinae TaxID=2713176 RepID=UPI0014204480|nr:DUF1552 domain-containing protein [Thalassoroseus pseudoceratinae]
MKTIHFSSGKHIRRRSILKAAGVSLALPWLDAMHPAFAKEETKAPPRRMIAINVDLGFMSDRFFPKQPGRDYEFTEYLKELAEFRNDFTVFSGLHHPGTGGQHNSDRCFLTAATHPTRPGFKNTISLDQRMADEIGFQTRWPSLALRVGPGSNSLSYTADGVRVPAIERPSDVYKALFVQGSPEQVRQQVQRLRNGQSLMDQFASEIRRLKKDVGGSDRQRLDQYFNSLRELETRLEAQEAWANTPKTSVDAPVPKDNTSPGGLIPKSRMLYDMARLALETDSTRVITILVNETFNPKVDLPGVDVPHHALTHQASQKGDELAIIERAQMKCLAGLLAGLRTAEENGRTLLDSTMVLHGSNIGDAARHDGYNLPVLLAGGGFRHGSHLAFDRKNNEPLANVFVSMLQRMGIEDEKFASSTGTIRGLELG